MQVTLMLFLIICSIVNVWCSYGEYVYFKFTTEHDYTFRIMNAKCKWGRFCEYENQDKELFLNDVTFDLKNNAKFGATGRKGSSAGVTCSFDISTYVNKTVSLVNFDCPWSGTNTFSITQSHETAGKYSCVSYSSPPTSGPLGYIDIQCFKIFN